MPEPADDKDDRLKHGLRLLVPEIDEREGWAAVQQRLSRPRRGRVLAIASVVLAAIIGVGAVAAGLAERNGGQTSVEAVADDRGNDRMLDSSTTTERSSPQETVMADGVQVEPRVVGPLEIRVGPLEPAENAWQQHDLVVTNRSQDPVTFELEFRAAVLERDGLPSLLVADEGCGYGNASGEAITPGCRLVERGPVRLEAGESVARTLTLWKELPGFDAPVAGEWSTTRTLTVDAESVRLTLRYTFR